MSHKTSTIVALSISAVFASSLFVQQSPAAPNELTDKEKEAGFVQLFDGKSLNGWNAQDEGYFRVEGGKIIADGTKGRSMLYYAGDVANHQFRNFVFRAQVYVHAGGNSGIYFHTKPVSTKYPDDFGYEAQIANTHRNPYKTGSLFRRVQVTESPVADEKWFNYEITVRGSRIMIKINGKLTADYTESADERRLTGGTIGLQCHDPAIVEFRSIRVRLLPD